MSTIQDILDKNFTQFVNIRKPSFLAINAFSSMMNCRRNLGGFVATCSNCNKEFYGLCSCGNRNCIICANRKNELFLARERSKILPINYYHITFTVPSELNNLIYHNQLELYNILYKSAIESLKVILSDSKYMGANEIGAIAILHSWGSNMSFHPHLHVCVSGIGLDKSNHIVYPKNDNYIFPEAKIEKIYRAIFIKYVNQCKDKLDTSFDNSFNLISTLASISKINWIVNIRDTMKNVESVMNYFARYANRVCISQSRIKEFDMSKNTVTFKYKDYKDNAQEKYMTLDAIEFMRRLSMHFLPLRFRKIREYGFLCPGNEHKLKLIGTLLNFLVEPLKVRKLPLFSNCCRKKLIVAKVNFLLINTFANNVKYYHLE